MDFPSSRAFITRVYWSSVCDAHKQGISVKDSLSRLLRDKAIPNATKSRPSYDLRMQEK